MTADAPTLRHEILTGALGEYVPTAMLNRSLSRGDWMIESTSDQLGRGLHRWASLDEARDELEAAGYTVSDESVNPIGSYRVTHIGTQAALDSARAESDTKWADAEPCYVRYGDLPEDGRSRNHADGIAEPGVSVFHGQVLPTGEARARPTNHVLFCSMASLRDRPLYVVDGREVGTGSDGEPVLADATIVRRAL